MVKSLAPAETPSPDAPTPVCPSHIGPPQLFQKELDVSTCRGAVAERMGRFRLISSIDRSAWMTSTLKMSMLGKCR
jgi:hypothetical protein